MNYKAIKYETEQLKHEIVLIVIDIYLTILFNREKLQNSKNNE